MEFDGGHVEALNCDARWLKKEAMGQIERKRKVGKRGCGRYECHGCHGDVGREKLDRSGEIAVDFERR